MHSPEPKGGGYVPRETDRRLGTRENPKPIRPNVAAPDDCWVECVGGYLRVMPPGDWIDYEGRVHYVQAGAPNVLSVQEAQLLADFLGRPCATESERPAVDALRDRLKTYTEGENPDGE